MRSPLNTIVITASYLAALNTGAKVSEAAALLIRSGASIQALLDDLVDFNRTTLGLGLKVVPSDIDLGAVGANELEQLRGANPGRQIDLESSGDLHGRWDGPRLQQLLRNLVSNAIKYGSAEAPVRVDLRGEKADVRLDVTNTGAPIDASTRSEMFDPLVRGRVQDDSLEAPGGLGLGLFIVREIASAHGGDVEVRSARGETTFSVRLPRRALGDRR